MASKTFDLLKRHDGEIACINGATQIRAGVIRPEVVIPATDNSALDEFEKAEITGLVVSTVRTKYGPLKIANDSVEAKIASKSVPPADCRMW